jgi:hypothetical protein
MSDQTSTSPTDLLNDFPDRLSPMLVKELRQGLRAKTFMVVFLVLQGLLGLILLGASASATSSSGGQVVSQIVFVFFSLAVLVAQPLRGMGAISSEIRAQTIDLMVLTRLSAFRIILGKWVAIVSQSALLASSIIPYLILRYYFGNMNLFAELLLLVMLLLISAGLTALTIGLSACSSIFIRGILPLGGAAFMIFTIFGVGFGRNFAGLVELFSFENKDDVWHVVLFATAVVYLGWSALSFGASVFAPHAENHSTLRRLIALGLFIAMTIGCALADADPGVVVACTLLVIAPAIAIALSENNQMAPTVARPFVRKGALGRLAGMFLYPGSAAGSIFTLLLCALSVVAIVICGSEAGTEESTVLAALVGSLLLPGAIVCAFGSKLKDRTGSFLLLWLAFMVMGIAMSGIAEAMHAHKMLWWFSWNPSVLISMANMHQFADHTVFLTALIVDVIYAGILLVVAIPGFRQLRAAEEEASIA